MGHFIRAHTGLLLQTQPLPTPDTELVHAEGWPDITNAGPVKKKGEREICHKGQA